MKKFNKNKILNEKNKLKNKEKEIKTKVNSKKVVLRDKIDKVKDKIPKTKEGKKNFIQIIILSLLIIFFSLFIVGALFIIITAPEFSEEKLYEKESTILYDKNGNEFASLGAEKREIVSYDQLPQVLVDAIVATEDSRFFKHNGFDIARFAKASLKQLLGDSSAGGASTLSMQVVKNTFTSTNVSIVRKFTDIYMAIFKIEKNYTKEQIIEFYVNSPFLGNNSYGVEQACQTYFGKSVSDLTLTEAALIAGLYQAPTYYNPYEYPENATSRRQTVLNLMYMHGYITKEEKEIASSIPVQSLLIKQDNTGNEYQGFIDTVVEEIMTDLGKENNPYYVPMKIYTTMDPTIQEHVSKVVSGEVVQYVNDKDILGIAVTSVSDGSITAIGSGRYSNTKKLSYNYATMIERHPGSSAKPFFDYGPLIEYNDVGSYGPFIDEPYTYKSGTKIRNVDGAYKGIVTMKQALKESRNVPALEAFHQVDDEKTAEFVHNCGITYGDNLYESSALGAFEGVNPLELSSAYGTYARGGYYISPYSYTKLEYRENSEVVKKKDAGKKTQVMSPGTATIINNILSYTLNSGLIGSISPGNTQVAGKTGTSTIDKSALKDKGITGDTAMDLWLAYYSPEYAIAQWYGYDEISKEYYIVPAKGNVVKKAAGRYLIKNVLNTGNGKKFSSTGVTSVTVEIGTIPAMLASTNTPEDLKFESLYKSGTEPSETSWRFSNLENVKQSSIKSSVSGSTITLNWDTIDTPKAIDTTFLQNYFDEGYVIKSGTKVTADFSDKYYEERINYNNSYIGTNGYEIYIKDSLGNLTSLGFTTNTTFAYNLASPGTTYTFVIKSAYSIFKSNMSSGTEIEVKTEAVATTPEAITTP